MPREPIIASHVKKLFVRAWFVELLYKRDMLSGKGKPSKTPFGRLIRSLRSYFKKKLYGQRRDRYENGRTYGNLTDSLSPEEIICSMIKAVNGMANVTEFHFEWRDLPLNKHTWNFLASARTAFDANLRKLVLRAQVCKFKQLLAITSFDHVCELDFHFDYHPNTSSGDQFNTQLSRVERSDRQAIELDIQDLLETVVPFINHRRISLNSLTISSSSTMDLSKFFKALLPMPALRQFRARIYFDNNCLRDVSSILQLLETHSTTLLRVELRPNLPEQANDRNQKLLEKQLDWLRLNELLLNSRTVLYGLESLEIPYVSPAKTVPLLWRSRDTLTRLYLTDHFLSKDEVTEVVGIFSHRPFEMQHLHVQVKNMDTSLIYMLASRLPGLFSLVLVLDSVPTVSDYTTFILRLTQTSSQPELGPPNKTIRAALLDWKLCCLSVYIGRHLPSSPLMTSVSFMEESEIMIQICALVPSVKYCKGYPNQSYGCRRGRVYDIQTIP